MVPVRMVSNNFEQESVLLWSAARKLIQSYPRSETGQNGVNLIGYFRTVKGIGEAARSSAKALNAIGFSYSLVDFDYGIPKEQQILPLPAAGKCGFNYHINIYHINPPQLPYVWWSYPKKEIIGRYGIGVWYWELPEIPNDWLPAFGLLDEVWVATQFVFEAVKAKSDIPVFKIPPCVSVNLREDLDRSYFSLPHNRFLFMCAYDVLSIQERKNPYGAINAFKKAFRKNDQSVGMVIKVNNASANLDEMLKLRKLIEGYSNFYIIEDVFDKITFNSLLSLVDVFVSLHRSEGFGLIPAEAMYLGKPVIMTRWSGNIDFMTEANSCGVNYKLVPIQKSSGPYKSGQVWADPDEEQAADFMKRLFMNNEYYKGISIQAKSTIYKNFSPEKIGFLMKERLQTIAML